MFLFFSHLFVCKLWPLSTFNFDNACLLLVGCISSGATSLQRCFDGRRNKELMNKGGIA
jgi:hypothetical protein